MGPHRPRPQRLDHDRLPRPRQFVAVTAATGAGNLRLYQAAEGGTLALVDSGTYDGPDFQGGAVELAGRPDGQYPAAISVANQRVWTAALTLAELAAEMESETAVRTSSLHADWPFQTAATATDDASPNSNDLALVLGSGSVATTSGPALGNATTGSVLCTMGITAAVAGQVTRHGTVDLTGAVSVSMAGARETLGAMGASLGVALTALGASGVLGRMRAEMGIAARMTTGEVVGQILCYLGFVDEVTGQMRAEMGITTTFVSLPKLGRIRAELGIMATVRGSRTVFGRIDVT